MNKENCQNCDAKYCEGHAEGVREGRGEGLNEAIRTIRLMFDDYDLSMWPEAYADGIQAGTLNAIAFVRGILVSIEKGEA